ncbi:MAG: type VI secretion system tip protein VgrG [Chromatiales bacterium]
MPRERQLPLPPASDLVTTTVKAGGEVLPRQFQVLSILVSSEINRIPTARITLADGDPASETFAISESEHFVPGQTIEIQLGYRSEQESVFQGIVVKHSIRGRTNGGSNLILECRDTAIRMTLERRSRYFEEMSDSDVAAELLGDHNLESNIEATSITHPHLVQYQASDWDFLLSRMEANGLLCTLEAGTLTAAKPALTGSPETGLLFGATLLDFDAEIDVREQATEVTATGWDAAGQERIEITSEATRFTEPGNLSGDELAGVLEQGRHNEHSGALSQEELQAFSDARLLRHRLAKIRGRASCQGHAQVKPAALIDLQGLGARFNGPVFVSGVRHRVSEGSWITDFQFGLDSRAFSETFEMDAPPAAGLTPAVSGLQIGVVSQIADDPDGEHRVQVRLPVMDGQANGVWARQATLDAGDSRGTFFRPEIDDEVLVGFLNDDPRHPVILGMLHSSAKPPPEEAEEENKLKGYHSREGMKLVFDDDQKSILLETPNGNKIFINDENGAIEIVDESDNKTTFSSDGILLESASDIQIKASGDINLEGTNINIKASTALKAEGSASAELSSSGTATVKGSMVMIN